jgi:leucyl/phenylalanyl-tRNA--protein transferase
MLYWLDPHGDPDAFPDPELAAQEPNGLLAVGGDLSPQRLLAAYRRGIFPWYSADEPILWWTPDPRAVLFLDELKISRSLRKTIRSGKYSVTADRDFAGVIDACATTRRRREGTWISPQLREAYCTLYGLGIAHSIETWQNGKLVGGLYGVSIGGMFFGESMFSQATDASKVAFAALVSQLTRWHFGPIDCQVKSAHLTSLGASEIPREQFRDLLNHWINQRGPVGHWELDGDILAPYFADTK